MIMYLNGVGIIGEDINYNEIYSDKQILKMNTILSNLLNTDNCIDDKIFNCQKKKYEDMCYEVLKKRMSNNIVYANCKLKKFMIFEKIISYIQSSCCRYLKKYLNMFTEKDFKTYDSYEDYICDREYNPKFDDICEHKFTSKINKYDIIKFVNFINNEDIKKFVYDNIYIIDNLNNYEEIKYDHTVWQCELYSIGEKYDNFLNTKHENMIEEINELIFKEKIEKERKQKELERELARKHIYKYNYVYLITDLTNNMKYIGKHSTNDLNDGYMGSGILLKEAQRNKGIEYFTKDILHMCETEGEAFKMERKEIDKVKAYDNNMYYNLV